MAAEMGFEDRSRDVGGEYWQGSPKILFDISPKIFYISCILGRGQRFEAMKNKTPLGLVFQFPDGAFLWPIPDLFFKSNRGGCDE